MHFKLVSFSYSGPLLFSWVVDVSVLSSANGPAVTDTPRYRSSYTSLFTGEALRAKNPFETYIRSCA
jgi:hypothetical protein